MQPLGSCEDTDATLRGQGRGTTRRGGSGSTTSQGTPRLAGGQPCTEPPKRKQLCQRLGPTTEPSPAFRASGLWPLSPVNTLRSFYNKFTRSEERRGPPRGPLPPASQGQDVGELRPTTSEARSQKGTPGSLSRVTVGARPPPSQGAQATGGGHVLWLTVPTESPRQPPGVRVQQRGDDSATVTATGPGTPSGHAQDRGGRDRGRSAGGMFVTPGWGREASTAHLGKRGSKHLRSKSGQDAQELAARGATETPRQVGNSTCPVASIAAVVGHLWLKVSPARVDRARRRVTGTYLAGELVGVTHSFHVPVGRGGTCVRWSSQACLLTTPRCAVCEFYPHRKGPKKGRK